MACGDSSGDINTVSTGELSIAPDEVLFREPERGSRLSRATVEVRNIGTGNLALVRMRLEEQDELTEIVIEDVEDHQGERFLEPEDVEFVGLEWTALDAVADQGRFIVVLADGSETAIPIRTPDIDPRIGLRSTPEGRQTMDGLTIEFSNTPINGFDRASVTIRSESVCRAGHR